jgi:hypothetical protein
MRSPRQSARHGRQSRFENQAPVLGELMGPAAVRLLLRLARQLLGFLGAAIALHQSLHMMIHRPLATPGDCNYIQYYR